jgi:hypothetical protein
MTQHWQYRSLDVDFYGSLRTLLGDLIGIDALAYELIQNADDVKDSLGQPAASIIEFDVCDDALYVYNDGVFRDIDFERMGSIAHGDKANEEGTTGTFGIGFTAVYQITDTPEIYSSNQHWILDPSKQNPQERIATTRSDTKGTKFRLPWAFSEDSELRKRLKRSSIRIDDLDDYSRQITDAVTKAALFLKQINRLTVRRNGQLLADIHRKIAGDKIEIFKDESLLGTYKIFSASFAEEANALKLKYPNLDKKKKSSITISLDITENNPQVTGLFYAVLPTQKPTGLPFSINADFYTVASRKDVKLDDDHCSEWNKAAIKAAAMAITEILVELRSQLEPSVLWNIIQSIYDLYNKPIGKESKVFWGYSAEKLRASPVVFTSTNEWELPDTVRIPPLNSTSASIKIIEEFEIKIIHEDLQKFCEVLQKLGVSALNASTVLSVLKEINPQGHKSIDDYTPSLRRMDGWMELDGLLGLLIDSNNTYSMLGAAPVAPCSDSIVRFSNAVYSNLDNTRRVFPQHHWLHFSLQKTKVLHAACKRFSIREAANALEQTVKQGLENFSFEQFYSWLSERMALLAGDHESKERLRRLPIWPVNKGWGNLLDASLPGDFKDTLQIANIVNITQVKGRTDLFREMDVYPLNLKEYIHNHVHRAFTYQSPSLQMRRELIALLCQHINDLQKDLSLREVLAKLPIVECVDGKFVKPSAAYMPSRWLRVLKRGDPEAFVPAGGAGELVRKLYQWLGMPQLPSSEKIIAGIQQICKKPPDESSVEQIKEIVRLLAKEYVETGQGNDHMLAGTQTKEKIQAARISRFISDYGKLKNLPWLPARKQKQRLSSWYAPAQLHSGFREYLFESQGVFIDLPIELQREVSRFLEFLGLKSDPHVELVVEHLRHCSAQNLSINIEVYKFLASKVDEHGETIKSLANTNCIFVNEKTWIKPKHAYWKPHCFGKARYHLDRSFDEYIRLFTFLGVKEQPDTWDYADLLRQLSDGFEQKHGRLDEDEVALVNACWEGLSAALLDSLPIQESARKAIADIKDLKVVLDVRRMLVRPSHILFADRQELVSKFGDLGRNVTIPFKQASMKALQVAGVRRFSHAVTLHLLENISATSNDLEAVKSIDDYKPLLKRIVQASKVDLNDINQDILDAVKVVPASSLWVQYELTLPWLNRKESSEPESCRAVFDPDSNKLYVAVLPHVHWPIVARELAYAILFNGEVGLLASPITNVLVSKSFEEASNLLDELGFSHIEETSTQRDLVANSATLIGAETKQTTPPVEEVVSRSTEGAVIEHPSSETREQPKEVAEKFAKADEANHNVKPATRQTSISHEQKGQTGATNSSKAVGNNHNGRSEAQPAKHTSSAPASTAQRHERLRSYVVNKNSDTSTESTEASEEVQARINQIDQAGVNLVMRFEEKQNRHAKQLPHDHEGYDIESTGKDGVRYIEVKSIGGEWDKGRPASLTPAQLITAKRLQDSYWLYVVEYALDARKAKIYVIQNPYKHISQFLFDDGWRSIAFTHFVE